MIGRRDVLKSTAATAWLAAAGVVAASRPRATPRSARYLVPGYHPAKAYRAGRPLRSDRHAARALAEGYDGPVTMISRLGPGDELERALFPIRGHQIVVHPNRPDAVFVGMNHRAMLRFDPQRLDLIGTAEPHAPGFLFGGHAVYGADGEVLMIAERRDPKAPYTGRPSAHFGRVSVRDPASLAVLDVLASHGIGPHEIALLADGRHLAIANYGSAGWPADRSPMGDNLPFGVEPALTLIEVSSGRLVHKLIGPDRQSEFRHLAAHGLDRITVLPTRLTTFRDSQRVLRGRGEVYQPDTTDRYGRGYLPVPLVRLDLSAPAPTTTAVMADDPTLMRRGQSIAFDPVHDEILATFTSSNTIGVFDGATGAVKRIFRTDRSGLRLPRGIALLADGRHYAVSGHWAGICLFRRGTHAWQGDACRHDLLFGHSHLTVL